MTSKLYINIIQSNSLFKNLSKEKLEKLFNEDDLSIKKYSTNEIIYFQNEECKSFDILLSGKLVVQNLDQNGNILTITNFYPGDSFGGHLIFADNNFYPMNVISKSDSVILKMKKSLVLKLCQTDSNFLSEILRSISNKTIIISNKIHDISLKTIRACILDYLKYEYNLQNSLTLKLSMTKKEWAEKIGVHRPSLSRELMKMKREGLIDYTRKSITIKKRDILN
ncbi:Crp/Fnr family transcriptional regulator [Clostridium sp. D2Q-11]|uniref:Crp/Fnr family transcriptional regulator n=1 Tax=Anaeromonas frigoriresistens TaxID=2683708 RepID=A0A942UZT3_9FIRM|nr:Crp/Fnr family transcriptional regulator [Anaeromonas frigoriresistens]